MQAIDQNKVLELSRKLVSFKSISPNQDGAIDYLQNYLNDLGFTTKRLDRGNTSNLLAIIGEAKPIFAFAGHVDIVPPGDLTKWQSNPFILNERDNLIYGRGIADMKGTVAAFIVAVEHYLKTSITNAGSIAILLTSDEESTAKDGTIVMTEYLKAQNITLDYCILGEPTSVEDLGDVVKIGRRGSLTGEIEVIGKQGHIAYPDLCKNPIHMFANALLELTQTKWDNGNEFFPATSLQFANINSGLGVNNVIPGSLFASFNFRYNNLHTAKELIDKINVILHKHNIGETNINWTNSAKPFFTKPGKLINTVKQVINEQAKLMPQLKTDGGTSDGRFLVEVTNELVEFGLCNKTIHQINEYICKNDLFAITSLYLSILHKIFHD